MDEERAFAELALHAELRDSGLARRDRALATELAYGTLRLRGRLDAAIAQALDKPGRKLDTRLHNLLRLGAYQILFLRGDSHHAAVDETVKLAHAAGLGRAAGFVNAVLRALARRSASGGLRFPDPEDDPLAYLVEWTSIPEWLAARWLEEFGPDEAIALAEASSGAPPRTVRVRAEVDREAVAKRLRGRPTRYAPHGVTDLAIDPVRDPGFAAGEMTVQDEGSQLVPLLLGAEPGDTVVDCCAAPGSKSLQLAEIVGAHGEVIALDRRAARLSLIRSGAARMGLANVRVLERDVRQGFGLQGQLWFRRILVDAPCSGLGTLRRNPDQRWRLRPTDIARNASTALAILSSAARYVADGEGVLVYSVCTMTPEETTGVLARFLEDHSDFRVDDPRPWLPETAAKELVTGDGALATLPHRHGCDGFWAVRLVRG